MSQINLYYVTTGILLFLSCCSLSVMDWRAVIIQHWSGRLGWFNSSHLFGRFWQTVPWQCLCLMYQRSNASGQVHFRFSHCVGIPSQLHSCVIVVRKLSVHAVLVPWFCSYILALKH